VVPPSFSNRSTDLWLIDGFLCEVIVAALLGPV
jgi:hypothetical protein